MHSLKVDGISYRLKEIQDIPEGMVIRRLDQGQIFLAAGPFGKILIQKFSSGGWELWQTVYQINKDCELAIIYRRNYLGIHVCLGEAEQYTIHEGEQARFERASFNLVMLPTIRVKTKLIKQSVYFSLDVQYPVSVLQQYQAQSPAIAMLLEQFAQRTGTMLGRGPLPITLEAMEVVNQLKQLPISGQLLSPLFRVKGEELLVYLLSGYASWLTGHTHFSGAEMEKIQAVRLFIDANYDQHFTIAKLAKQQCMNTTSLKNGFKKQYGVGPYTYLQSVRMIRAKALLQEGKHSVSHIADACGYGNTGSFIKVFKRHFGITPGSVKIKPV